MAKIVPNRVPMPRQDAAARARNFDEVATGYTEEMAQAEAARCLQCKNAPCIQGCPVEIDIPGFIALIRQRDYAGALQKLRERNCLPAVCGRVCPQEDQCEKVCTLGKKFEPVAIGRLERFVADWEQRSGQAVVPPVEAHADGRVAVVGSGPSGLTVAGDLLLLGHRVTIFEAFHKAGGVLVYGIPEFRLPKQIVQREVDYVVRLGAELRTNFVVGRTGTIDELMQEGYDAVFVGVGAGLPYFMDLPGEDSSGVYSANEFLTRTNLMKAYLFPEYDTPIKIGPRVVVVGGGNVAMDSARTALRLGAKEVHLVYRRSRVEMPARAEEAENAEEEGVIFHLLTNPTRIFANESGWVNGIECIRMKLGEPDASGRRRPLPVDGSEFRLEADAVVMAIGSGANPLITSTTRDLKTNRRGYIIVDQETGATSKPGVYAGGDIVTGSATVIQAMGAGRTSARAIHDYLCGRSSKG